MVADQPRGSSGARSAASGRAAPGGRTGNSCGFALQLIAVAVGLGAVIARSDAVFVALKWFGAAYLVALGVRKIRDRRALGAALDAGAVASPAIGDCATTLRWLDIHCE